MRLLDTTLRDGEQTPGVNLNGEKKLAIAKKLDEVGVDVIEAGSACVSEGERDALRAIAKEGLKAEIASFSRVLIPDIDAAIESEVSYLTLVVPTSDLHIEKKLRKTREQVEEKTVQCIGHATEHGLKVEVLAEDGSRTGMDDLVSIFKKSEEAGAAGATLCDTVGVLNPELSSEKTRHLVSNLKMPVGFHGHNDLGLAVANSLSAYRAGAQEIHCTINGMGERAGNAPLDEVALDLKFFYNKETLDLKKLYSLSKYVSALTGLSINQNKPLVGPKAFAHESGIHVDGVMKDACTYEPIAPEMVGQSRTFSLGKHSGKGAIKKRVNELGLDLSDEQVAKAVEKVKAIGDKGKEVTDAELQMVAYDVLGMQEEAKVKLDEFVVVTGNKVTPTASVKLFVNGKPQIVAGVGNGPVDAAVAAIEKALGETEVKLTEYHVDSISGGADALVHVRVKMRKGENEVSAYAATSDIVMASIEAALRGINLLI